MKVTLSVECMPAVIAESVAEVLAVHHLSLSPELLREIGNNAAQKLFGLDESLGYEIGHGLARDLREAFERHGLVDDELLASIDRLERFEGVAEDVRRLAPLAKLAGLHWQETFPEVFAASPAVEERDAAGAPRKPPSHEPVASRSGCTPPPSELIAVGATLRSLAALRQPNPETAEILARVGEWLQELGSEQVAKQAAKQGRAA